MWESVKRILRAYAAHDSATGYVQSMNFLTAFLLLAGVSEEDAFWCLVALVSRVVPGYFSEGMAAAKLDARVFGALLHAHLPALGLHLSELGAAAGDEHLITGIIAGQWLLTLFVNVLPTRCCLVAWDEMASASNRAPLFAAALALLGGAEVEVCGTGDMGEALELLQGLGARVLGSNQGACEAFEERLRALARGPLSSAALGCACARELGEGGPEAGLGSFLTGGRLAGRGAAGGAPGYAAATDTSELLRGTRSGGLYPVALGREGQEGGEDANAGLQAELAAVQCLECGTPKAGPAPPPGAQVGGGALSAEDVLRVCDGLVALERALREAPWLRASARDAVRTRVLRPLGALAGARLARARGDFGAQHDSWAAAVDGVLVAKPLATLDTRRPTYLLMWEHGACEAALAGGEMLLERLSRLRNAWRKLAHALASDAGTPGTSPSSATFIGSAGGLDAAAATMEVSAGSAGAAAAVQEARGTAALEALRQTLFRRMAAAAEDLPLLDANEGKAAVYLSGRAQAASQGVHDWLRVWEARRAAGADAAADALLAAAAAAADALQGGEGAASVQEQPAAAGEALPLCAAAAYETEQARCAAALAALAIAQRGLSRRGERLAREAALVRAVTARALHRSTDAEQRAQELRRAAQRCRVHLAAMAAPEAPAAADDLIARLTSLHSVALSVVIAALSDTARFIAESATATAMTYVSLIDRCLEELGALGEQVLLTLRAERDREAHKVNLGREMLSAVGTLSKAVQAAAAGTESDEEAAARAHTGARVPGIAGASMLAGALRRGLRDVAAVARGFEAARPHGVADAETEHAADSPLRHSSAAVAAQFDRERCSSPLPSVAPAGDEEALDAEGRPRRKGKAERALEEELRALTEHQARLLERKETLVTLLRGAPPPHTPKQSSAPPVLRLDEAAPADAS